MNRDKDKLPCINCDSVVCIKYGEFEKLGYKVFTEIFSQNELEGYSNNNIHLTHADSFATNATHDEVKKVLDEAIANKELSDQWMFDIIKNYPHANILLKQISFVTNNDNAIVRWCKLDKHGNVIAKKIIKN